MLRADRCSLVVRGLICARPYGSLRQPIHFLWRLELLNALGQFHEIVFLVRIVLRQTANVGEDQRFELVKLQIRIFIAFAHSAARKVPWQLVQVDHRCDEHRSVRFAENFPESFFQIRISVMPSQVWLQL